MGGVGRRPTREFGVRPGGFGRRRDRVGEDSWAWLWTKRVRRFDWSSVERQGRLRAFSEGDEVEAWERSLRSTKPTPPKSSWSCRLPALKLQR